MTKLRFGRGVRWGGVALGAAVAAWAATITACYMAEVDGERATTGTCPAGETCSDVTPTGLTFVGAYLFDDESTLRLGPVIVGGRFDLGFYAPGGGAGAEGAAVRIGDPSMVESAIGTGTFGPTSDETGEPLYVVDGYAELRGVRPGTTTVRVVDPATGALYDRLELEVLAIESVRLMVVGDPGRDVLYAGEDELLGIRLVTTNGTREIRAIDQSLEFHAEGTVQPELMYWDCFTYEVPSDRTEMRFEIVTGGQRFERVMRIEPRPAAE